MSDDLFELTEGEKRHPLWVRLKAHLEHELDLARKKNDNSKLSEQDTAALRGNISRLKIIIDLGKDRPLTET